MPNILLMSKDDVFAQDLSEQIHLYAPDFAVYKEPEEGSYFDVIIVDEDINAATTVHERQIKVPVFLLSAVQNNVSTPDFINAVVSKPFSLPLFLEQLKSCINFYENSRSGYLHFNKYILKPIKKEIYNTETGESIKLTEKEVSIIKYLYKSWGKIVTKNELLQYVWGYSPEVTTHTLETHIYRLRQKVEHEDSSEQLIQTTDGGYKLNIQ